MKFEKSFLLISFTILILFIIVQYTIYNNIKNQTIRNLNVSQQNHAQQAVSGIQGYMSNIFHTLNFLSQTPGIIQMNEVGRKIMENYQLLNSEDVEGITRIDSTGKIIFTFPDRESIGRDISNQEHVKLITETHKPVVSDMFMAVQGFRTIAYYVPVFQKGRYIGALSILLPFDRIIQKYINNIHIGKNGYAWVVSSNGIEISSPIAEHIGKNIYDTYKNYPDMIAMFNKMFKGGIGYTTYHYNRHGNLYTDNVLKQAVYTPISIENTTWYIIIATPEDELIASLSGLRMKLFLTTIALLAFYVIIVYYNIRYKVVTREQEKRQVVSNALKESESRYKALFEQNPAPTLIYEVGSLKMLAVNNVFLVHYGYTKDEILNMHLPDLYPDDLKNKIADLIPALHGYQNVGEWRHCKKDGTEINIVACSNDLDYNGYKARIAVITDITENKRTEELIEANEKRHSLIFDTISDILILLSVEHGDIYSLIYVNSAFLKTTGLSREQIIGKSIKEVLPASSYEFEISKYTQAIMEKRTVSWEEMYRFPNGNIYGAVSVTPSFNSEGQCTYLIGSIHDITEIKLAEAEINKLNQELEQRVIERTAELEIAKERAESADMLKSAFLATMSHELRTPLNSIIGFTGILMKQIAGPLNDEQLKQLGMAKNSARHLLELINDVLDISKIEAGQLEVTKKIFNVCATLQNVCLSVKPLADKKNLNLDLFISDDVKEIIGDERRVGQVFLNLINNAIKFTEKGFVKINCFSDNSFVIAEVIDSGIGIKNEDLVKLFKPFSQIDTGLSRNHEGTGLGLSISQKLVEKMGGTITVESEEGKGSKFIVKLPVG